MARDNVRCVTAERARFDATGVVHLPSLVPADEVRAMRAAVWRATQALDRLPEQDGALRPGPGSEQAMAAVVERAAFDGLALHLGRGLDAVFGPGAWVPTRGPWRGVALPNLPGSDARWSVPHRHWHVDEPTTADRPHPYSLGAFVFVDRVAAGGGATVAMLGSPRRLRALAVDLAPGRALTLDESTRGLARVEPWVDALLRPGSDPAARHRRFMIDGCVSADVPLRVVELIGEPGDLILMDLRCLHAPSANVGDRPRLIVKMACVAQP